MSGFVSWVKSFHKRKNKGNNGVDGHPKGKSKREGSKSSVGVHSNIPELSIDTAVGSQDHGAKDTPDASTGQRLGVERGNINSFISSVSDVPAGVNSSIVAEPAWMEPEESYNFHRMKYSDIESEVSFGILNGGNKSRNDNMSKKKNDGKEKREKSPQSSDNEPSMYRYLTDTKRLNSPHSRSSALKEVASPKTTEDETVGDTKATNCSPKVLRPSIAAEHRQINKAPAVSCEMPGEVTPKEKEEAKVREDPEPVVRTISGGILATFERKYQSSSGRDIKKNVVNDYVATTVKHIIFEKDVFVFEDDLSKEGEYGDISESHERQAFGGQFKTIRAHITRGESSLSVVNDTSASFPIPYYFGDMSREQSESILNMCSFAKKSGLFLVRLSTKSQGNRTCVVSLRFMDEDNEPVIKHFLVKRWKEFEIESNPKYDSLDIVMSPFTYDSKTFANCSELIHYLMDSGVSISHRTPNAILVKPVTRADIMLAAACRPGGDETRKATVASFRFGQMGWVVPVVSPEYLVVKNALAKTPFGEIMEGEVFLPSSQSKLKVDKGDCKVFVSILFYEDLEQYGYSLDVLEKEEDGYFKPNLYHRNLVNVLGVTAPTSTGGAGYILLEHFSGMKTIDEIAEEKDTNMDCLSETGVEAKADRFRLIGDMLRGVDFLEHHSALLNYIVGPQSMFYCPISKTLRHLYLLPQNGQNSSEISLGELIKRISDASMSLSQMVSVYFDNLHPDNREAIDTFVRALDSMTAVGGDTLTTKHNFGLMLNSYK
eukprot:Nk52_evm26s236 gene=Nk52_evmTU26s236